MDVETGRRRGPRLRVVGTSGAGKTRLARHAADILGVGHLELDAVFWDTGWTYRDPAEARDRIREFLAKHPEGWVVDGNWNSRLEGLLDPGTPEGADSWVWLDQPRWVVMWRVIRRTLARGLLRRELWHGNRENVSSMFRRDPQQNIVRWAWTTYETNRQRMLDRVSTGAPVVWLRGQREIDVWLASLLRQTRREP